MEKLFFECEPLRVIAKKTVRNTVYCGIVRSSKKSFSRHYALSCRHKFLYLRNFIDPGHSGDVFDVDYVPFVRSAEAAISRGAAAGALVAISVNVNKPKLQNFDRPLGLPGHLQ